MMRKAYSGIYPNPDDSFTAWWRHGDQRRANLIEGMTLAEIREFGKILISEADRIERIQSSNVLYAFSTNQHRRGVTE